MPFLKALVVEDYEAFRRFIRLALQQTVEFQVIAEVSDGLEAVQKAKGLQPDLVLLDIGLPALNGLEAGRRIREVSPNSKILFLSQESCSDVVREALSLGAVGYVVKSRAQSDLRPAIEAVLRGEYFVTSALDFGEGSKAPAPRRHENLFFSDEAVLLDNFARAVSAALNSGNAAIVVATASHRETLLERLKKQGLDIEQAIQKGNYIAVGVAESLSAFMVNGLPDPIRFFRGISGVIAAATKAANATEPRVIVCGEGVAVLLAEGKTDAAIRLEQLCDEVAQTQEVDVLCAYPLNSFHAVEK
jgi:DNA-binding NarL/FixJ family response regulator